MKYFVKIEMIGIPPSSPQESIQHLEQHVIPHLESIMKLESEGKILASGVFAGERAGVLIVDVNSNEELDQLITSIPAWHIFKIETVPLQTYEGRIKFARQSLENLKATTI